MQPYEVYYLIDMYDRRYSNNYKSYWKPAYLSGFGVIDCGSYIINNTRGIYDPDDDDIVSWTRDFNCQDIPNSFIPDSVENIVISPQESYNEPDIASNLMNSLDKVDALDLVKSEIGADFIYLDQYLVSGVKLSDNYFQKMAINNAFRYFEGMPNQTTYGNIINGVKSTQIIDYADDGTVISDDTTTSEITHSSELASHQIRVSESDDIYYVSKKIIISISFEIDIAFRYEERPNYPPRPYPFYEVDLFEKIRFYLREKTYDDSKYVFDTDVLAVNNGDVVNLTASTPSGYPMDGSGTYTNYANYYRESYEMKNLSIADLAGIYGLPYK